MPGGRCHSDDDCTEGESVAAGNGEIAQCAGGSHKFAFADLNSFWGFLGFSLIHRFRSLFFQLHSVL